MYPNYSKYLLGLEDVFVKKVLPEDFVLKVLIETKAKPQTCPVCGCSTSRVHDYRKQSVASIPIGGKKTTLILRKRRYACSCGKRFYEHYDFLPRYQRRTRPLSYYVVHLLRQTMSLKQVSELTGVSVSAIARVLDTLHYGPPQALPKVLSIDEFKGNAETGKYQCILVDPVKHRILDILPDRTQSHLADYWRKIPRSERLKVQFFVSDMWKPYVELAGSFFPNAKIVIDKYHFTRQVNWAIERVRKRLQKDMPANLRKYYKRSRKLILARYHTLEGESKEACDLMLLYNDDLRLAHYMKEKFFEICQMTKYRELQQEFDDWIAIASKCRIEEFNKCAATLKNWRKEILNAFKYGYTNGCIEGFNNKIKVLKRSSYGIRRFDRFRTRILHCTS